MVGRRLLLMCKAYPPTVGGVETYSEQVARAYTRLGLDVVVLTSYEGSSSDTWRHYPEGLIRVVNVGGGGQLMTAARMWRRLGRMRKTFSFDFAHATTWRPAALLQFGRPNLPYVVTVHGREVLNFPVAATRVFRRVFKGARLTVAVSSATLEALNGVLPPAVAAGRQMVAHNGISFPMEAATASPPVLVRGRRLRLLTVARLVRRKNIAACIRALSAVRGEGLDEFEYRIAGTGPEQAELKRLVRELGLDDHVAFLDYVPDDELPALYRWADGFLHPQTHEGDGNDFEGFGLVIADAMSFGCAVVAGAAGGPSDFVTNGVSGLLVDGLDQKAVTGAVRWLLSDTYLVHRLGGAGRKEALNRLSWDAHVEQIIGALDLSGWPVASGTT